MNCNYYFSNYCVKKYDLGYFNYSNIYVNNDYFTDYFNYKYNISIVNEYNYENQNIILSL
jgi:hypothetical protein